MSVTNKFPSLPLSDNQPLSGAPRRSRGVVDIAFVIDCTGSMQTCINALKDNIGRFVDFLVTGEGTGTAPVQDWRARVCGYRDWEFDKVPFEPYPFVRTADDLKAQLACLKAEGGVDEPECLLDALYAVATSGQTERDDAEHPEMWRHRTRAARVVIVFTDATFKEVLFLPEARGGSFDDVVNALVANRVLLTIFAPDKMACHDRLSNVHGSEYEAIPVLDNQTPQEALAKFTSDTRNFERALKQLAAGISRSASIEIL